MKHVAAALLLALAGKEINEKNINEVLGSAGIKPTASVVALVVAACKGKNPNQLIAEGMPKLASAVAVAASTSAEAPKTDDKKDAGKKKEEPKKKEEKKPVEEEEDFGFGGLF